MPPRTRGAGPGGPPELERQWAEGGTARCCKGHPQRIAQQRGPTVQFSMGSCSALYPCFARKAGLFTGFPKRKGNRGHSHKYGCSWGRWTVHFANSLCWILSNTLKAGKPCIVIYVYIIIYNKLLTCSRSKPQPLDHGDENHHARVRKAFFASVLLVSGIIGGVVSHVCSQSVAHGAAKLRSSTLSWHWHHCDHHHYCHRHLHSHHQHHLRYNLRPHRCLRTTPTVLSGHPLLHL